MICMPPARGSRAGATGAVGWYPAGATPLGAKPFGLATPLPIAAPFGEATEVPVSVQPVCRTPEPIGWLATLATPNPPVAGIDPLGTPAIPPTPAGGLEF